MAKDQDQIEMLLAQIVELKKELSIKSAESLRYKMELQKTNLTLEKIIYDLTNELKMAAVLQKYLSPTEIPHISGVDFSTKFLPGTKSGGDYFDIFEHDDRLKFGLILSSSSGYTMSALFLSILMKLSAQMEARKGLGPDKVILQMAQELSSNMQKQDLASVFYGVMDRRNYEFSYCLVGNIIGVYVPHGGSPSWLEPSSGPLQKDFAQNPLAHTLQMGPRDRLILLTEGVLSAVAADKNDKSVYGKERLLQSIQSVSRGSVHDVRNEILYQVEKFSGINEPLRDQTVLVTEVKDKVIKLAKKNF